MTDYSQFVLLPTLLERLAAEAPGIELVIRPIANAAAAVSALEEGPLDLGITATKDEAPGFHRRELFRDRYVCLIREAHPDIGSELTVRRYATLRHVLVAPQGGERSFIDDLLAQRDLKRRIATRVPGFAAVPWIVAGADVAATVPARIAEQHASALRLRVLDVPLPLGTSVWSEFWHDRVHVDRGHVWMRNLIADVAGALR
jgi:DNA-binding transcriptional LysR family regulator